MICRPCKDRGFPNIPATTLMAGEPVCALCRAGGDRRAPARQAKPVKAKVEPAYAGRPRRSAIPAHLGVVLRLLRTSQGLTQKQLAQRVGSPRSNINRLECGVVGDGVGLNMVERLAGGLRITVSGLVAVYEAVKKGNVA